MINKIIWKIRKKGGTFGINYFFLFYPNLCANWSKIISSYFIPIFANWDKLFSLNFIPIFANWNKISPINRHLIATIFIFIIIFAIIWQLWGK